MNTLVAFLFLGVLSFVSGEAAVRGRIALNDIIPDLSLISHNTRVVLNGGQYVGYVKDDGSFSIPNVPDGIHILDVQSTDYTFDKIRVDVGGNRVTASITQLGMNYARVGPQVRHPLELPARAKTDYFMPRESFNIMGLFANPMLLMTGVSMLMFLGMPYLMKNIDPETLKEMQEKQSQQPKVEMPDVAGSLANWMSGAGSSTTAGSKPKKG
ncbi:hypothetical protein BJ742DRAFT_787723 [Cladochytrium replicatum]|nr:hypothetical protein BJ742DRAFT_787723 [Cladochytrium replicatum]